MQESGLILLPLGIALCSLFVFLALFRRHGIWKTLLILLWMEGSSELIKIIFSLIRFDSNWSWSIRLPILGAVWWFGGKLIIKWYDLAILRFKKKRTPPD